MFLAVNKFYLQNQALIDGVQARALGFGQLGANITAINVNLGFQTGTTKGITLDKKALRTSLNEISLAILSPARAWAISEENNSLAEMFHVTPTELNYMKDDTVGAFCRMRHGLVNDKVALMTDYGITTVLLETWASAIDAYEAVLANPRNAIVTRKQKTANLKSLFQLTSKLFSENLDLLMVPLSLSNPEEYGLYRSARIIIDHKGKKKGGNSPQPPTQGTVIDGLVFNADTDMPLEGLTVTATYPDSSVAGTATTTAQGAFKITIQQLPLAGQNTLMLHATFDGYEDANTPLVVEAGRAYLQNIPMTPTPPEP